jgi:putative Mn2+ efflux pump MntP
MVSKFAHWIAFFLLLIIGANMVKEALSDEDEQTDASMSAKKMFPLAIATSIDALAVGITFAFLKTAIVPAVTFIGATTFVISAAGVKIGSIFGTKYKTKAEVCGGIILILLGIKILIEGIFG